MYETCALCIVQVSWSPTKHLMMNTLFPNTITCYRCIDILSKYQYGLQLMVNLYFSSPVLFSTALCKSLRWSGLMSSSHFQKPGKALFCMSKSLEIYALQMRASHHTPALMYHQQRDSRQVFCIHPYAHACVHQNGPCRYLLILPIRLQHTPTILVLLC